MGDIIEALLDALKDSLICFAVVLLFNFLISFLDGKLSVKLKKESPLSPLLGASFGLIPQCGFSVIAADLYMKEKITMGTLVAVFIACSDEALPILLSHPDKILMIFPLLLIKLVAGFIFGVLLDTIFRERIPQIKNQMLIRKKEEEQSDVTIKSGCYNPKLENKHLISKWNNPWVKMHVRHPLFHSLKIFVYVLIVNIIFSIICLYWEEQLISFLNTNVWLTPLFSLFIGYIPNCASSVLLTNLYINNTIKFGAAITGLCANAGLGLIYIFKDKKKIKNAFIILASISIIGLLVGYSTLIFELLIF